MTDKDLRIEKAVQSNSDKTEINKQRLNNVINKVTLLAGTHTYITRKSIFYVVKIYADKINSINNTNLLEGLQDGFPYIDNIAFNGGKQFIYDKSFRIELGKAPVISRIRRTDKLLKALDTVDNKKSPFQENYLHHAYNIFLPIGLTIVYNGNHTANAAILKNTGFLEYRPDKRNSALYDLSPLYEKYYFDGTNYKDIKTDEVIGETLFEYGCLFEIGRVLKENNINALDYFNE